MFRRAHVSSTPYALLSAERKRQARARCCFGGAEGREARKRRAGARGLETRQREEGWGFLRQRNEQQQNNAEAAKRT